MELYHKYRPQKAAQMVGQDAAVAALSKYITKGNLPHAILFCGPTGTGKTTLAHCLRLHLGCTNKLNHADINCAVMEPMATVQSMATAVRQRPLGGDHRVWILEEVQSMSRATHAQQGLLRVIETAPPHNYFFLCTTDTSKVIAALRGRCTEIRLKPITTTALAALVVNTAKAEGKELATGLADKIADAANGSARNALVLLEKVLDFPIKEQAAALDRTDPTKVAFDLVKALMPFKGSPSWKEVATVLEAIKDEEAEGIRQMVMATCRTHLLNGNPKMAKMAYVVIEAFRDPFFGQKNSDNALLAAACYAAVGQFP